MQRLPILTLFLFATVLPELFTGSTPLTGFLNPGLVLFLSLGYGLPVLLIRELAVRYNVGLRGLIFFGLAYSLLNEGLLAKTVIIHSALPVHQYDDYGCWLGISFPWAAGIGVWHAFASVIFPVALTHFFFPQAGRKPWLNSKVATALGIFVILFASLVFLGASEKGVKGTPLQHAIILAMMFTLFSLGFLFKGGPLRTAGAPSLKPMLFGMSILLPFTLLSAIAGAKVSPLLFFIALAGVIFLYGWLLKRFGWLSLPGFLCFGVGWYLQNAGVSVLLRLSNPPVAAVAACVDALILLLLWRQIRRAHEANMLPSVPSAG